MRIKSIKVLPLVYDHMSLDRVRCSLSNRVIVVLSSIGSTMSLWLELRLRRSLLAGIELFEKIITFSLMMTVT